MITQELIDYAKTQLSSGVTREKITSDLLGQGWSMEQINEAFGYAEQSIPTQMSYQTTASDMTQAPVTIKYFEWLMYASFLASVGIWVFQFGSAGFQAYMLTAVAVPIIGILLKFFCVYKVAYHRAEWARIVLVVLLALNAFSIFGFFFYAFSNPIFLVTALPIFLPIFLEIAAIYFVFNASSNAWLATNTSTPEASAYVANNTNAGLNSYLYENKYWSTWIPSINKLFMLLSLVVMFLIHPFILVTDALGLGEIALIFYGIMFFPLAIFVGFYLYENKKLKARFANTQSKTDPWFLILIIIRNIVFGLNFIPFIQIIGAGALGLGIIPYLLIYYFLVRARNKSVVAV